jgi:hypothetical protein
MNIDYQDTPINTISFDKIRMPDGSGRLVFFQGLIIVSAINDDTSIAGMARSYGRKDNRALFSLP